MLVLHARSRLPEQQLICIHIAAQGLVLAGPSNGGENRAFRFACSFYVFCITARDAGDVRCDWDIACMLTLRKADAYAHAKVPGIYNRLVANFSFNKALQR
jgi:hypothetical protein